MKQSINKCLVYNAKNKKTPAEIQPEFFVLF